MTIENQQYNFQKMTPTKVTDMRGYKESLDFVFENKKLLNIAITGPYGSGKTSVIETYEKSHKNEDFVYVSLADFNKNKTEKMRMDEREIDGKETKESVKLEGKILNQIIHQLDPKKIPQTEFRTRTDVTKEKIWFLFGLSSIFILLTLFIFNFKQWGKLIDGVECSYLKSALLFTNTHTFLMIVIVINFTIFGYIWYLILKNILYGKFLKRIKWDKSEIELFNRENDSYFDKHLDEILYLFRKSNLRTIVFEDIDRYNKNEIFSRLREINDLINKTMKSDENYEPIRFLYLLKDNMFSSRDRTKFFDFIIPIVPVTDGSNSFNQLKEILEQDKLFHEFDNTFLERLCLYIDDMRLLKNIYNEYLIYYSRLEGTLDNSAVEENDSTLVNKSIELNCNKLFAIIVYKNVFPEDFSLLQYRRGFVYNLIANRQKLIDKKTAIYEGKIESHQKQLRNIRNEHLNSIDELDAIYFVYPQEIKVKGNISSSFEDRASFIRAIKENNYEVESKPWNSYSWYKVNIQDKFEELEKNENYVKRRKTIGSKKNIKNYSINESISGLKEKIKLLKGLKLQSLLDSSNIDSYFEEVNPKDEYKQIYENNYFDLIRFLLRNGYIDEDFHDYIAYFIPNNLTLNDKVFLRSISDERNREFEFPLDNPEMITDRLRQYDFMDDSILNFDLLTYLISSEHKYLTDFIKHLQSCKHFNFLLEYLNNYPHKDSFVRKVNENWSSVIHDMNLDNEINSEHIKTYLWKSIEHSDIDTIVEMNIDGCLTNFIIEHEGFLITENPDITKAIKAFKELDVKFTEFIPGNFHQQLFEAIYKKKLYEINTDTLLFLMRVKYNDYETDLFTRKNYSILLSKPNEPLYLYVQEHMMQYMDVILEFDNIEDHQEAMIEILNHESLNSNYKKEYIEQLHNKINEINSIKENTLWETLVENNKVDFSVDNLLHYYIEFESIREQLVKFINETDEKFEADMSLIESEFSHEVLLDFTNKIIESVSIDNYKYQEIIKALGIVHEEINFGQIDEDKFRILLEEGSISMNIDNLNHVKEAYVDLTTEFILRNFDEYILILQEFVEPEKDELESLLVHEDIEEHEQLKLLQYVSGEISLFGSNYPDSVRLKIIENNFLLSDLEILVENYNSYNKTMQNKIVEKSIAYIDVLIEEDYSIDMQLLDQLFKSEDLGIQEKRQLFYNNYTDFSLIQVKTYLELSKLDKYRSLLDRKRPSFPDNEKNRSLLEYFEKQGWISSFKIEDNLGKIIAYGRRV